MHNPRDNSDKNDNSANNCTFQTEMATKRRNIQTAPLKLTEIEKCSNKIVKLKIV